MNTCVTLTGIHQSIHTNKFIVYPNPNNGIFTVEGSENKYELILTNVFGEKITQTVIPSGARNLTIDLSAQPNGIYLLQIKSENGTALKKIIINN